MVRIHGQVPTHALVRYSTILRYLFAIVLQSMYFQNFKIHNFVCHCVKGAHIEVML